MTILDALQETAKEIKAWVESKFLTIKNIDSTLSSTSENPVQNKVINTEINNLKNLIGTIDVSEQISSAISKIDYPVDSVNGKTGNVQLSASDVGALPSNTSLSDLKDDATHRTVTDVEKASWNAKSNFSGDYNDLINLPTFNDFGVYVQAQEPTDAVAGDIWIDTINNPSYIPPTLPEITETDNGKVLMVVNGKLQLIQLNLYIDANGVISM